jgi:hypothetical protein
VRNVGTTWLVSAGGGEVDPANSVTDQSGRAQASLVLGRIAGANEVTASVTTAGVPAQKFSAVGEVGPLDAIAVTPPTLTLGIGESRVVAAEGRDAFGNAVSNAAFAWSSDKPAVATVSETGVVSALAVGAAAISASSQGRRATINVTVTPGPVARVKIRAPKTAVVAGETPVQLAADAFDAADNAVSGRTPTWSSATSVVGTVSSTGLFNALAAGTTLVTATIDGRSDTVTMSVSESIGIFSETPPRLIPDTDTRFGIFVSPGADGRNFTTDVNVKVEGAGSLKFTVTTDDAQFAGWYVAYGDSLRYTDNAHTRDMAKYALGSIRFWVNSPVNLEVGIRSGNVPAGAELSKKLLSDLGVQPGTTWKEVCVPLPQLSGNSVLADLTRIKILFVVAVNESSGGTDGNPVTFWVDDVRWDTRPC